MTKEQKLHKKYDTSSYYARNITSDDVLKAKEVIPSEHTQIEEGFVEKPHRDETLAGLTEKQLRTRFKRRYGKTRRLYTARGHGPAIDELRQANIAYSDRVNLLQPQPMPIPSVVDVTGQPVKQKVEIHPPTEDATRPTKKPDKEAKEKTFTLAEVLEIARSKGVELPPDIMDMHMRVLMNIAKGIASQEIRSEERKRAGDMRRLERERDRFIEQNVEWIEIMLQQNPGTTVRDWLPERLRATIANV